MMDYPLLLRAFLLRAASFPRRRFLPAYSYDEWISEFPEDWMRMTRHLCAIPPLLPVIPKM